MSTPRIDLAPDRASAGGGAEVFVWPPRRGPIEPAPADSIGQVRIEMPPLATALPGAEDLAQPARLQRQAATPPSLGSQAANPVRAWSSIEHTWLDLTAPPLKQRMAAEYWSSDTPADYCPRCGITVGRHDFEDGQCGLCRSNQTTRLPWQRIIRLGEYEAPLSQWICEVKFTRWRKLGRDLGHLLGESILVQMGHARAAGEIPDGPPLIVPVPMSLVRRLARGIDHTRAIARGVADRTGGRVVQPIRRDHRPSQTHVAPSRRRDNLARSIHPRAPWFRPRLAGRLVIVIDDVTTTTSTLRAACRGVAACAHAERRSKGKSSRGNPPILWAAVLAKTPADSHDLPSESIY